MTDIDYAPLAKALFLVEYGESAWENDPSGLWGEKVRAVVAAYIQQMRARGVVEVDQHDLAVMGDWYQRMVTWSKADKDVYERVLDGKEDRF